MGKLINGLMLTFDKRSAVTTFRRIEADLQFFVSDSARTQRKSDPFIQVVHKGKTALLLCRTEREFSVLKRLLPQGLEKVNLQDRTKTERFQHRN